MTLKVKVEGTSIKSRMDGTLENDVTLASDESIPWGAVALSGWQARFDGLKVGYDGNDDDDIEDTGSKDDHVVISEDFPEPPSISTVLTPDAGDVIVGSIVIGEILWFLGAVAIWSLLMSDKPDEFECVFTVPPDDTGYDDMVAELSYQGSFVCLIHQENGFGALEIEIHPRSDGQPWRIPLLSLERAILRARQRLWDLRKTPSD